MEGRIADTAGSRTGTLTATGAAAFAFALGVGVILHGFQRGHDPISIGALTGVLAIAVAIWPRRAVLLAGFGAALLGELVIDLPGVWNHTVITGLLGGGIATFWLVGFLRKSDGWRESAVLVNAAAPMLRVGFLVVWFAAALAKVNREFLSGDHGTCGIWILDNLPVIDLSGVSGSPSATIAVVTVVVEFLIPVLLLSSRTRVIGVAVAWLFHFSAALGGHTPFSGIGWSFYLLFLPPQLLDEAVGRMGRWLDTTGSRLVQVWQSRPRVFWWAVVSVLWVGALAVFPQIPTLWAERKWAATLVFVPYALVWARLLWMAGRDHRDLLAADNLPRTGSLLKATHPIAVIVILLLAINAMSPYLGLKTGYSFTMYSNLRTEVEWNHLIVPEAVQVMDLQEDVVYILSTDDARLESDLLVEDETEPAALVLIQARKVAERFPDASVEYELNGVVYSTDRLADDPILGQEPSWIERWLGNFRPIPNATVCQH